MSISREYADAVKGYNFYVSRALSKNRIDMRIACSVARSFSVAGDAVLLHPDFPKKPPSLFHRYIHENKISVRDVDKDDYNSYKVQAQKNKEEEEAQKLYVQQMRDFLADSRIREGISGEQVNYVKRKIKFWEKKVGDPSELISRSVSSRDAQEEEQSLPREVQNGFRFLEDDAR